MPAMLLEQSIGKRRRKNFWQLSHALGCAGDSVWLPIGNAVVMDRKGIEPSSELYSSVNERKKASTLVLYYVT